MKTQNGNRLATALILHSFFFLLHFPKLAKGEIASLAGAADDPRYDFFELATAAIASCCKPA